MKYLRKPHGLSIVATIIALLMLSLFIAVAVSLITTGAHVGVQEEQGAQALFIADGGLQYTLKRNNFPYFAVNPAVNLGKGSFTVSVPTLSANINAATTGPVTVSSTDGFITAPDGEYWIMLCDTQAPDNNPIPPLLADTTTCEKISFTGKTSTTFTGGTRGRDISSAAAHLANTVVLMYSWNTSITTTLNRNLANNDRCQNNNRRICVSDPNSFESSGFIRIANANENNREDIFYFGNSKDGGNCGTCPGGGTNGCLGTTSCIRRAYSDTNNDNNGTYDNDSANGIAQSNGTSIYPAEISALPLSTGVIASNPLTGNIQRKIQISVLPLQ